MKKNNEIKVEDFEKLVKKIDTKKYRVCRSFEVKNNVPIISKWEIFNKEFDDDNIAYLASYKGNNLQDIINFIESEKQKQNKDENVKAKIFDKLVSFGIPINGLGIKYWTYLLSEIYNNQNKYINNVKTMDLYKKIGNEFNSSLYAVERVLRCSTKRMQPNIIKQYNLPSNITLTNSKLINLFINRIFNNEI